MRLLSRRLNQRSWEFFSDRLTDFVVKPEDREKHQEQARLSALYKNGFTGSPGRMDYLYFVNGYRSKLFIVWTSKKIRRSIRKRNKIMSIQRNNSVGKEQFTALPENPRPSVLSAMDLTR